MTPRSRATGRARNGPGARPNRGAVRTDVQRGDVIVVLPPRRDHAGAIRCSGRNGRRRHGPRARRRTDRVAVTDAPVRRAAQPWLGVATARAPLARAVAAARRARAARARRGGRHATAKQRGRAVRLTLSVGRESLPTDDLTYRGAEPRDLVVRAAGQVLVPTAVWFEPTLNGGNLTSSCPRRGRPRSSSREPWSSSPPAARTSRRSPCRRASRSHARRDARADRASDAVAWAAQLPHPLERARPGDVAGALEHHVACDRAAGPPGSSAGAAGWSRKARGAPRRARRVRVVRAQRAAGSATP
jgi:hypothetical protein